MSDGPIRRRLNPALSLVLAVAGALAVALSAAPPAGAIFWTAVSFRVEMNSPRSEIVRDLFAGEITAVNQRNADAPVEIALSYYPPKPFLAPFVDELESGYKKSPNAPSEAEALHRSHITLYWPGRSGENWRDIPTFFAQLRGNPEVCRSEGCRLLLFAELSEGDWSVLMDTYAEVVGSGDFVQDSISFRIYAQEFEVIEASGRACTYALYGLSEAWVGQEGDWLAIARVLLGDAVWWAIGKHPLYENTGFCGEWGELRKAWFPAG